MSKYEHIKENELDRVDRLGLAFCRLNCGEWDEIIGPKPDGFDEMVEFDKEFHDTRRRTAWPTKHDYIGPALKGIEDIIGDANTSRCWWKYELGRSEQEWLKWYVGERLIINGYDEYGYLIKPEQLLEKSAKESAGQSGNDDLKPGTKRRAPLAFFLKNLLKGFLFFLLGFTISLLLRSIFKL